MTKEKLRTIKNNVKATLIKMFEDDVSSNFDFTYLKEKVGIIREKVINLCNKNSKIAEGVMDLALKELINELHEGSLKDVIKQISEKK